MVIARSRTSRPLPFLALTVVVAFLLAACGSSNESEPSAGSSSSGGGGSWPLTFTNADGSTTEIPAKPQRIASTTVSTTGTLLAIGAPVVASGAAGNGKFFDQWAPVAAGRKVATLWSAGSVDLEAVYAAKPDLIVVSSTGADSVLDQVAKLKETAPTIVVDYGGQTWEELAVKLGEATGLKTEAEATVTEFNKTVADAKAKITVPAGQANIVSYNGAGEDNPIAKPGGAQGKLLTELGFTVEAPDESWHTQAKPREDFVFSAYENLTKLTAQTTFILSAANPDAQKFAKDPVLANVPSVKSKQVYGLGVNSFRVDPYSAKEIVDGVVENFGS